MQALRRLRPFRSFCSTTRTPLAAAAGGHPHATARPVVAASLLGLMLGLLYVGPALAKTGAKARADSLDDRFDPWAFIGEVNNRFASSRRDVDDGRDTDEKNRIDRTAGFGFDYRVVGAEAGQWQVMMSGETIHTVRTIVTDTTSTSVPNTTQFLSAIRDANVFEALVNMRFRWTVNWCRSGKDSVPATAVYVKGQGGFIRTHAGDGSDLANHFVGVGVEHLIGPYKGSFVEVGTGRTELFEKTPGRDFRKDRFKLGGNLNYTPGADSTGEKDLPIGLFAQLWLDSDIGPGSDDLQLYLGLFFNIAPIFALYGGKSGKP